MSGIDLSGQVGPLGRPNTRFQETFAISGGGYRGLFCAEVLARIEGDVAMRDRFDLIAGTSIGGIIACALAVGIRATEIRDAIAEHGKSIFPGRRISIATGARLTARMRWRRRSRKRSESRTSGSGSIRSIPGYSFRRSAKLPRAPRCFARGVLRERMQRPLHYWTLRSPRLRHPRTFRRTR